MINLRKKLLSALLAVSLMVGTTVLNMPFSVSAVSEEITVTVSMEGLTLGQGMYFEPETYTLSEINYLVATEGYGPFDESNLNAGIATLAFFIDNGIEYENTGSWGDSSAVVGSSFYLSSVKNIDKGYLNIPKIILEKSSMSQEGFEDWGNDDDYLGEFDYNQMSGWMVTVNDLLIPVGVSSWTLNQDYKGYNDYGSDYVVRWQFTLNDYGADLGLQGFAGEPYYDHVNKDLLYKKYAELSANGIFDSNAELKKQTLSVMENLTATQKEVDTALTLLESANVDEVLNDTFNKLSQKVSEPVFGTTGGEWTVLALARGNYFDKDSDYFKEYYDRIVETVNRTAASVNKNGALHSRKYTENSRLIMALSSIGKDSHSVGDWDIIAPLENYSDTVWQGINGPIFALIALDTQNYQTSDSTIRQQYIDYILAKEIEGGGWALSGSSADPDITAMALQALANYTDDEEVAAAVERGINTLSSIQKDNGGYASWGSINSESIAQVITACAALGIDPATDERFVKNGHSAVDALLEFYDKDSTDFTFRHTMDGTGNAMATDQAAYALVAYQRFVNGKNSLYDMTDVELETIPAKFSGATLSLAGNIGVNFHMELDDSVINDADAYMQFILPNGDTSKVMVKNSQKKDDNGKTYYVFSCEVAAKEMSDTITAQIIRGNGKSASIKFNYSVEEYTNYIEEHPSEFDTKAIELVEAMIDYGNYASAYFDDSVDAEATAEMKKVTENTLSDFAIKFNGTLPTGVKYYGSSLILESNTTLRHYFEVADNIDVSKYNFSGNKGNYYYIDISDISADKLDVACKTSIGGYTVSYSPMSYAYAVLSSDKASDSLKNVVRALFLYNQAANAYQNK